MNSGGVARGVHRFPSAVLEGAPQEWNIGYEAWEHYLRRFSSNNFRGHSAVTDGFVKLSIPAIL